MDPSDSPNLREVTPRSGQDRRAPRPKDWKDRIPEWAKNGLISLLLMAVGALATKVKDGESRDMARLEAAVVVAQQRNEARMGERVAALEKLGEHLQKTVDSQVREGRENREAIILLTQAVKQLNDTMNRRR